MSGDGIHYDYETGRPSEVVQSLRRRVSALTRPGVVRGFKIGITNDPPARFSKYPAEYDEMLVVYGSRSLESVSQVERELVEHNWDHCDNDIAGGGGGCGEPPYYLYVALRH